MKAAVLHEFKHPLVIEDVPRPQVQSHEVVIEVEACGVCHSDLHVADGDWKQLSPIIKKPLILGHEIVGRVTECGGDVRDLRVGDRVGVPWIYSTCGKCEFCCEGNENLCVRQQITGVTVDGGYADFVRAPASHAIAIHDALSPVKAAPLFCAGVTVYRAMKQATLKRGQRLAVFGVGGLGHIAVQIGCALGADVTAIDIADEKLALARSLGASAVLNARSADVVKSMRSRGGAHVTIVTSAAKAAYNTAFNCLRPTGTLLVVGLPAEDICFPPIMMSAKEVRIRASAVGTREDLREVLAMAATGQLHCETTEYKLDQVNEVMDRLRGGQIVGRAVLGMR